MSGSVFGQRSQTECRILHQWGYGWPGVADANIESAGSKQGLFSISSTRGTIQLDDFSGRLVRQTSPTSPKTSRSKLSCVECTKRPGIKRNFNKRESLTRKQRRRKQREAERENRRSRIFLTFHDYRLNVNVVKRYK